MVEIKFIFTQFIILKLLTNTFSNVQQIGQCDKIPWDPNAVYFVVRLPGLSTEKKILDKSLKRPNAQTPCLLFVKWSPYHCQHRPQIRIQYFLNARHNEFLSTAKQNNVNDEKSANTKRNHKKKKKSLLKKRVWKQIQRRRLIIILKSVFHIPDLNAPVSFTWKEQQQTTTTKKKWTPSKKETWNSHVNNIEHQQSKKGAKQSTFTMNSFPVQGECGNFKNDSFFFFF